MPKDKKPDYIIHAADRKDQAQNTFNRLCSDIAAGIYKEKIVNKNGEEIQIPITPDNFKMAYDRLDQDALLYKCRLQLPKYFFISADGKIISLSNNKPIWYMGNSEGRTENERQVRISSSEDAPFIGDGKKEVNIYNYTMVALVYNSIIIADDKDKDNIKNYGLEAFGVGNSGHGDKNKIKGAKGLVINGKEVIKPNDMFETHHVKDGYIIDPDLLEIMPHWLHERCKYFTASIDTEKAFKKLFEKEKKCSEYLARVFPTGYKIIDYSKEFDKETRKTNRYIYYSGINNYTPTAGTIKYDSRDWKYFAIIPYDKFSEQLKIQINNIGNSIIKSIKDRYQEAPIKLDINDIENQEVVKFIDILSDDNIQNTVFKIKCFDIDHNEKYFYIVLLEGNIQNYKLVLKKLLTDNEFSDKTRRAIESYLRKNEGSSLYITTRKQNNFTVALSLERID